MPFYISLSGYSLEREDKMYDIKKTGEIIKKLRTQSGKTQERIAEEMGINIKTYRAIESGNRGGSVDTLCVIAQYHNVTLAYLVLEQVPFDEKTDDEVWDRLDVCKRRKIIRIAKLIISILEW